MIIRKLDDKFSSETPDFLWPSFSFIFSMARPILFLFTSLLILPLKIFSSPDSEALLKLKHSFLNAAALHSWHPGTEPCLGHKRWKGVQCKNGRVSGLHLRNLGLLGNIDIDALVSMSSLRNIAFMSNSFTGYIPSFNRIGALRGLYISDNQFSGEIPSDYFVNMAGLKKIWMSGNRFSGPIPSSLSRLSHLIELHLDGNHFSGGLPILDQKSLISLNVSSNNLAGEIPPGMSRFGGGAFQGNPGLCGGILGKPCKNSYNIWLLSAVCLVAVIVLFVLAIIGICLMRRRQVKNEINTIDNRSFQKNTDSVKVNPGPTSAEKAGANPDKSNQMGSGRRGPRDLVMLNDEKEEFGLADLMRAAAEVLGNGALGSSYKAKMVNGLAVVVKRIKEMNRVGRDRFDVEMKRIGSLRHKNVLTPLAYHYRKEEKLLVSEYQPMGSLMFVLHGDREVAHTALNWPTRLKIIRGIARGLDYLHTELSLYELPHGDLKSCNILLTSDYEPLLVDYGFYPLMNTNQAMQVLVAYKSPEASMYQNISPKCDVYCLGIIILEILTGKFPCQYHSNTQGGTDLIQWARSAKVEGREAELVDPDIAASVVSEMVQLLHIGMLCTEDIPNERLDLKEAIKRIEGVRVDDS